MAAINAKDTEIQIVLPVPILGQTTLDVTADLISNGNSVEYNFLTEQRVNNLEAVDGSLESFQAPSTARYLQIDVKQKGDVAKVLDRFLSYYSLPLTVSWKDKPLEQSFFSGEATITVSPANIIGSEASSKQYRLECSNVIVADI